MNDRLPITPNNPCRANVARAALIVKVRLRIGQTFGPSDTGSDEKTKENQKGC
jgi:hypothetical protein